MSTWSLVKDLLGKNEFRHNLLKEIHHNEGGGKRRVWGSFFVAHKFSYFLEMSGSGKKKILKFQLAISHSDGKDFFYIYALVGTEKLERGGPC
jgi:hypothetical protein